MNIKVLEAQYLHDMLLKIKLHDQKEYLVDLSAVIKNDPIQTIHALRNKNLFNDLMISKLHQTFKDWGYI
ncbi:MAG: hypothetical protein NTV32_07670 [Gammaproteobacteria bacterium]|nr:hypothetical protein [Gammaproteobacteria bacterium]